MNKDVQRTWIEALRSGEYQQAQGALHNEYGHCCLGVLCELAVKEEVIAPPVEKVDVRGKWWRYGMDEEASTLPLEVMAWAGLNERNPKVDCAHGNDEYHDDCCTLAGTNDGGASFHKIADIIEKKL